MFTLLKVSGKNSYVRVFTNTGTNSSKILNCVLCKGMALNIPFFFNLNRDLPLEEQATEETKKKVEKSTDQLVRENLVNQCCMRIEY